MKSQNGMAVWLTPELLRRVKIVQESEGDDKVSQTTRRLLREVLKIRGISDSKEREGAQVEEG